MIFRNPLVLGIIPLFLLFFFFLRGKYPEKAFLFSSGETIKGFRSSIKLWLARKLIYVRVICIVLFIIALARPQMGGESKVRKEGIAIILCIDTSSTMLAEDLELSPTGLSKLRDSGGKNRIDAVREVAEEFIKARKDDLVGIVAFAAHAYVVCPPTFDKNWLLNSLERVQVGLIKDATAIGSGILSSLNSLRDIDARSKVIVLLTDGINNFGNVPPLVAAKAARTMGVKIYTVGIASKGRTPFPAKDIYGHKTYKDVRIDIDEDVLKEIANLTGGEYYRVSDMRSLEESYKDIDVLETVELDETPYEEKKDMFQLFLLIGLAFLLIEIVLSNTFLRRIP